MDSIKQWIFAICISAIVGGIILILSPEGSTEKAVRTAVSLVLLCVILSPFTSGINSELPVIPNIEQAESIEENTVEIFKKTIEEKIAEILVKNSFINPKISIDIITQSNEMTVNSVKIIADSGNTESARKQIRNELGIDVEIEVQNE